MCTLFLFFFRKMPSYFCITIGSRVDDLVRKRHEDDDEILSFLLPALRPFK
jgi:hypothetical protein